MKISDYETTIGNLSKQLLLKRKEYSELCMQFDSLRFALNDNRRAKTEVYQEECVLTQKKFDLSSQIQTMIDTYQKWQSSFIQYTDKQKLIITSMNEVINELNTKIVQHEKNIEEVKRLDNNTILAKDKLEQIHQRLLSKEVELKQVNNELIETINKKSSFLQTIEDKLIELKEKEEMIVKREKWLRINLDKLTKIKGDRKNKP